MKKKLLSSALLLFISMIWGFAFVAQVAGTESIGTFTYTAMRFLLGAAVLTPLIFIFSVRQSDKKKLKSSLLYGLIGGVLLFVPVVLQQFAIEFNPDGNSMKAGFITGLYTISTPICQWLVFKKKTSVQVWIGAVSAVIGLYLLCGVGGGPLHFTDALLFITVPLWSAQIIFIDNIAPKVDLFAYSVSQYSLCGIISLVGACIFDRASLNIAAVGGAFLPIFYGGVLSVGVAYTLQIVGQKHADPTSASIILSTESVFGCIGNLIFLSVNMTFAQYIGCALIFAGIVFSQLVFNNKKKKGTKATQ